MITIPDEVRIVIVGLVLFNRPFLNSSETPPNPSLKT